MAEKKLSILIVDDEPEIVNSLYDTFVDKYKMFKAYSAKEALGIIEKNRIDLVISDQRMPEITGVELFEKMEKDHPHIGKVLLTGYSNIHAAVDAINKGHVDKYITKPWEEDDITHIILEVMDTRLKKAIKERKRADRELRKSEQALRDALELSSCITNIAPYSNIIMDSRGIILEANPASESIFEYKIVELRGKHISILVPPGRQDEYTKYIERYLTYKKSGKPEHRRFIRGPEECAAIRKNGEVFPVLLFIREAKSKGKDIFVGIIEEFTERRKREKELKKAEQYIRNLIECSIDMIISVDKERNIVEFNKAAEKTFGYKKEEIIGKNIEILYGSHEEAETMSILLQGRDHFSSEILNKRKNGEIFPSFASISVIQDAQGNRFGTMGVSRDITHQKEAEEELREAKNRAEEANKTKDEFLANISHEIRTPLNGIIGMTELLIDTDIRDVQLNLVRTLDAEANSLLSIINNVLDFSKIEAAKLDLEAIDFNLNTLVDDIANSFAYRATQKGLELHSFISPDVPYQLIGDPVRLRQILTNLIGNSLKFTHEGEIFIKTELKEDHDSRVDILFSIKDTGIGIPKEKQKHIFESFWQEDGSTTRKYGGTGLGTTIAKQLVTLMGGEICLESEEGKGSMFCFNAIFSKQEEKKDSITGDKLDLTGKKILIVDDNETNRFILMEHLKSRGCLTIEASGGREALDILNKSASSQQTIDLVITDYMMPEMDGFGLVKLIKEIENFKKIPIILLTSVGEIGDSKICRDLGIEGYLTKPIRQDYLHQVIESVFIQTSKEVNDSGQTLVTRHTIADKREKDVEILLAEDYPTNQEVAIRHLQSAGYRVDLAENGVKAFEAYKKKLHDIIYMDIQMPEMDGYEATAKIRDYEKELKNSDSKLETHAVIIAMTAHATAQDRKKCLDRGMDDFIPKPLRRKELLELTDKWVSEIHESQSSATGNSQSSLVIGQSSLVTRQSQKGAPINLERAIDEFEGDKEYLIKVLKGFLQNVNKQIITIRKAISDGDADTVRKEAHSIKGGAGNLTADTLAKIALELENIGKSENLKEGSKLLEMLEKEFHRLEEYVEGVKGSD